MSNLDAYLEIYSKALMSFKLSITLYDEHASSTKQSLGVNKETLLLALQDSKICRFKYCANMLSKLVRIYLEEFEKVTLESVSPRGVIRDAVKARLISEQDGTLCLIMINKRNETSHIYHEEVAIDIARSLPEFYQLMERIVAAIKLKSGN